MGRGGFPITGALSSAQPETHEPGLEMFRNLGGSRLHLHGEGGETHSKIAAGEWLKRAGQRSQFTLCTQICHDEWDEPNQRPMVRFSPVGVKGDIASDLQLLQSSAIDIVYLDDHPELPFEPVIEALAAEVSANRILHVGVRNWRPDKLRACCEFARSILPHGIEALVTTELALPISYSPLWPEYVPFDDELTAIVRDEGLVVYAHCSDITSGQCLFGDEVPSASFRAHWVERWPVPENKEIVQDVLQKAVRFQTTPRAILLAWMLSRPLPVVPIIGMPDLLKHHEQFCFAVEHCEEIWEGPR